MCALVASHSIRLRTSCCLRHQGCRRVGAAQHRPRLASSAASQRGPAEIRERKLATENWHQRKVGSCLTISSASPTLTSVPLVSTPPAPSRLPARAVHRRRRGGSRPRASIAIRSRWIRRSTASIHQTSASPQRVFRLRRSARAAAGDRPSPRYSSREHASNLLVVHGARRRCCEVSGPRQLWRVDGATDQPSPSCASSSPGIGRRCETARELPANRAVDRDFEPHRARQASTHRILTGVRSRGSVGGRSDDPRCFVVQRRSHRSNRRHVSRRCVVVGNAG